MVITGHFATSANLLVVLLLSGYVSSDCPLPDPLFPNGNATVANDEFENFDIENLIMAEELTILSFTCFDDYFLIGDQLLQCIGDKWDSEWPICADDNKCSKPPIVQNAVIKLGDSADPVVGSTANYSCKDGYELSNPNSSVLQCSMNRGNKITFWDGEKPVCRKKRECNDPGTSPNGKREGNCCLPDDTLRFSCNENYELVGKAEIRCLRTGLWSSRRPLCRPLHSKYCEFPEPIPHAMLNGSKEGDYFVPGEEAEVWCKPGYRCESNDVVKCLEGGTWDKKFGVCKEVFCDPPPPVEHGKILELQTSNLTKFPFNYDINYVCDEGYRIIIGDSWRMCTKAGVWSGRNTTCEEIRCPDPGTPENGIKSGFDYSVGSRIHFSCDSGYELLGEQEILCQGNGQWAGELARCNSPGNDCPDPGTPIRGSRNKSTFQKGDIVKFKCDHGMFLLGSETRLCLPDGTWNGTSAKCVAPYDFDNAGQVRDHLFTRIAELKEEHRKELQWFEENRNMSRGGRFIFNHINFPGRIVLYFAFDVSGSIPLTNFKKSIEFAKAIVREVGVSEDGIRVGAVTFANKATGIFLPLHHNTVDGVLDALDGIEHTGGSTSASSVLYYIRTEYIPLVENQLPYQKIKSIVIILTDGRANMGGSPKTEADILKSQGVEIYCVGITGNSMKEALYEIASKTTYGEEKRTNVFMLQDYGTLAWLVHEVTYGTANYSQCGLGKEKVNSGRIVGGSKVTDPWPWMAALYMADPRKSSREKVHVCGGSIIHPYIILTAAHCVDGHYKETNAIAGKEIDIKVKLGLTNVDDTTHLQEFEVRKIYIHDKFLPPPTLDYDVALLELREPIQYNAFVRPICLPPKVIPVNNPFYKTDSIVWIAGWGHVNMRKEYDASPIVTVKHLKEISLSIQSRETCEASLSGNQGRSFTDRMFCAGTGGARNDSCEGDSGGPVMERYLNKAGYPAWTQVGLVSWGVGCGLPGEFGMYVHLQRVMPWVAKKMEEIEEWRKES